MNQYQYEDLLRMRSAPKYKQYLASFCRPFVSQKKVTEVGAGLGDFGLSLVQFNPHQLVLLEPGGKCFAELKKIRHELIESMNMYSFELLPEKKEHFDTVIYNNALEHIENDQQELTVASQLIRPGGHVVVIVPAHPFLYSEIDRALMHFRRYTRKSFIQLASQIDTLEAVECFYINKIGVAGWLLNNWLKKIEQSEFMFRVFDTYMLPISRRLDAIAPQSFGLTLVAVLRKRISDT